MISKYEEKIEYEKFISSLNIVPNHNYIEVSKGSNPAIFTYANGSAVYEFFISKQYLLIFTHSEIILKKYGVDIPKRISHKDIYEFQARELPLTSFHCISFKAFNRKYYFYIDADDVFSLGESSYSSFNYYFLREKKFFGLLDM
ncbi:hypothetical protein F6X86_03935 [Enterococcus durans]|uniref:Uncharacterized protein n=1 Tax=Enterococcus durans TaxID=53345 RepID=A0A5N0YW64_9ENTE|nr:MULTISPECIES: hypothetical protein [Enterococcus]KAA9179903.1 hypothetical protein F6X86_03935 [Enterococcus durans]KAA9186167.1 hypothetical protein F6X85_06170 [Enterococcus durans]KAA9186726.1 hypothetical protein F6X90_05455 [Enterococcus durans]KAA9191810.1 hypothetical protein F6Y12_05340 [Enterococcus durans]KAA9193941.1 hypothetical protein F6X88_05495 [Enterococcus durans]